MDEEAILVQKLAEVKSKKKILALASQKNTTKSQKILELEAELEKARKE